MDICIPFNICSAKVLIQKWSSLPTDAIGGELGKDTFFACSLWKALVVEFFVYKIFFFSGHVDVISYLIY